MVSVMQVYPMGKPLLVPCNRSLGMQGEVQKLPAIKNF
ncbi:hypothetical protein BI036_gp262 [Morganella phage vB_MmoM_MP1]|uniref:Uncharacterized protein n=1 Tax=Morganella phage vB_MmoM_MP1 TaxID=1852628 RepID=A0A192YBY1_9CAUD|nr:hypothetical protein BI036_gp262 [Morganella phage vB_MmoM_MP1]ANM46665.1 hypothetical protein MP1_gp0132 [Morganella phage vB_MmoM_MP1]